MWIIIRDNLQIIIHRLYNNLQIIICGLYDNPQIKRSLKPHRVLCEMKDHLHRNVTPIFCIVAAISVDVVIVVVVVSTKDIQSVCEVNRVRKSKQFLIFKHTFKTAVTQHSQNGNIRVRLYLDITKIILPHSRHIQDRLDTRTHRFHF